MQKKEKESVSSSWQKFLQPLVTAAIAALSAYTAYAQRDSEEKTEARFVALELRADMTDKRSDRFRADIDNFKVLLGDIRSDVSYIRGKLESRK
jgi:hypothetical protein